MFRVFKYRLYPTPEQAEKLAQFAGATRFVYNLALEQRRDFWRQYKRATGKALTYASQGPQVTALRKEAPWLAEAPCNALHGALQDLDKAFVRFFGGGGFPKFRRVGVNDSFEIKAAEVRLRPLNRKWTAIRVPNLGWVKFRDTRARFDDLRSARVVCKNGQWFVCLSAFGPDQKACASPQSIGIDRGVTIALALSNGEQFFAPKSPNLERKVRSAARVLSRRKRGSRRYAVQRKALASIKAGTARIRSDWQHKATTDITKRFGIVAIEALRTRDMTRAGPGRRKAGLNRSIQNVGWATIERMLDYKLAERGGTLVKVNPAYTSQTCSACGAIDRGSRESQASFHCLHCGHEMNADHNAAINILRQGLAGVDGCGCAPDEARTIHLRPAA